MAQAKSPSRSPLVFIFLTVFIDLIGFGIVLPMLPIYSKEFGASGFVLGIIIASFSAMQFIFAPWWGQLSDRMGRRPVLLVGLIVSLGDQMLFVKMIGPKALVVAERANFDAFVKSLRGVTSGGMAAAAVSSVLKSAPPANAFGISHFTKWRA